MSQPTNQVTVICPDRTLAWYLERAARRKQIGEVIREPSHALWNYWPALYVHTPLLRDSDPPRQNVPSHDDPLFQDPFPGQTHDFRDAVRRGKLLTIAFVERDPSHGAAPFMNYPFESLQGLLPDYFGKYPCGFVFKRQPKPEDTAFAIAASAAEPWMKTLLPHFLSPIGARIEAVDPLIEGRCDEATRSVEDTVAFMYSHTQTGGPIRDKADIQVQIKPLLVNPVGDWFACAVLIDEGAVLLLPECKSHEAKAEVIRLLASGLWQPVQEWLRGDAASVTPGKQGQLREPFEPSKQAEPAAGVWFDKAAQLLVIDGVQHNLSVGMIFDFLSLLASRSRIGVSTKRLEGEGEQERDWKNAVDMLRKKIGLEGLKRIIVAEQGTYRLHPSVNAVGDTQVAIRPTYQKDPATWKK